MSAPTAEPLLRPLPPVPPAAGDVGGAPVDSAAGESPASTRPSGSLVPTIVATLAGAAFFAWQATKQDWGPDGYWIPWIGLLQLLISWIPGIAHRVGQDLHPDRAAPIPFFPVISFIYGVYYGLAPVIADDIGLFYDRADPVMLQKAQIMAFWGWIAQAVGFYAIGNAIPMGRPIDIKLDPERGRTLAVRLILMGMGISMISSAITVPGSLAQPMLFLGRMYKVGVGMLFLADLRGTLPKSWKKWVWGLAIPSYTLIQVGVGSVAQLVYVGAFFVFLWWAAGKRMPWLLLACGGLFVVLLRGNAKDFRDRVWFSEEGQEMGSVERTIAFFELLGERFAEEGIGVFSEAGEMVKGRVAHIALMEHCVDQTPLAIPYWGGHTYKTLPASFIPRVLWPNKPSKQVGQDFGHRYHIIWEQDKSTAVNLPQMVELFINFGFRGMIAGMVALGVLYRFIYRKLNAPGVGDGTILIAATLFSLIINIESDFSMVYGALVQRIAILWFFLRWARPKIDSSAATPRAG